MGKYCVIIIICLLFLLALSHGISHEYEMTQSRDILYANEGHGFTLTLPEYWEGEYFAEEHGNIVSLYHTDMWLEQPGMGRLFDIHVFTWEQWAGEGQEIADMTGLHHIYADEHVVFAAGYCTDIQIVLGNQALCEEYRKLHDDIYGIVKTFCKTNDIKATCLGRN